MKKSQALQRATGYDVGSSVQPGVRDRSMHDPVIDISVVVPVFNEEDNVAGLIGEIATAFAGRKFEMIFVDDASTDATAARLVGLKTEHAQLRALSHRKNAGQSRAVHTGVHAALGRVVVTLDGDGQNDPADGPAMVDQLLAAGDGVAMIGGRRTKRQDSAWKKLGSRLGNGVRKRLLNDSADDTGCGLKAFHREAFLRLPYFDHMHRFLPALMLREGFDVDYCDVNHRGRWHGHSKYTNFGRLAASLSDLFGVMWLNSRARQSGGYDER